ncbi:MAG: SRPBCC family protein [Pseudonocardiaceae bacterium]
MSAELTLRVDVDAPPETVWAAATDWERQREWLLGTRVRVVSGDGVSVGSELEAVTGASPLAVTDHMRITGWQPPWRCDVAHTGRVVRGTGVFAVEPRDADRATFVWTEKLELPLGALGRLGWSLARPAFTWGLRRSLCSFAEFCRAYRR